MNKIFQGIYQFFPTCPNRYIVTLFFVCHLYCTSDIWVSGWKLSGYMKCVTWITNIVMGIFSWRILRRFRYPEHRNGNYCRCSYFDGDGVPSARRCDERSGDYRRTHYRTRQTKWVPFSYKLQKKFLIFFVKILSLNITLMILSSGRRSVWDRREFLLISAKFEAKLRNKSPKLQLKSNPEKFTVCEFVVSS